VRDQVLGRAILVAVVVGATAAIVMRAVGLQDHDYSSLVMSVVASQSPAGHGRGHGREFSRLAEQGIRPEQPR